MLNNSLIDLVNVWQNVGNFLATLMGLFDAQTYNL